MVETIETKISEKLWEWRFAARCDRDKVLEKGNLSTLIEFWMPFDIISGMNGEANAWCDGIPILQISDISRTAFLVSGVGYFPHTLAPFEVEFHYAKRRDVDAARILLRWGNSNRVTGRISSDVEYCYSLRPRTPEQWRVYVEITPINRSV